MPVSINNTQVVFNDATTQTTAPVNTSANVNSVTAGTAISVSSTTGAVTVNNTGVTSVAAGAGVSVSAGTGGVTITNTAPAIGSRAQVFTGSGTFTIPTGVTALKVSVVGGGGGGAGGGWYPSDSGAGGASSVASGSQSITTISTGGGGGARANGQSGSYFAGGGGAASGGDINLAGAGGGGYFGLSWNCGSPSGYKTARSIDVTQTILAMTRAPGYFGSYGSAGRANIDGDQNHGGQGGFAMKYLTGLTPGATLSVTVGAAGAAGTNGGSLGANGAGGAGLVLIEF